MAHLPRLVIAAPATGQGKTTIAAGLMAALRSRGLAVSGHKVGPDYIDPGYHALATGRPGRNLDPHLVGEDRIVPLLLHGAAGADVAVIEGVMGLYDGRLGTDGFASTAHVASLTCSPVVLVLDVARASRTAAAVAVGMAAYDARVTIAGVVLNRTGSARNDTEIISALERAGLPVLGALPRDTDLATPSRHLGLVPAAEREGSAAMLTRLGEQVAAHLDVPGLLSIARAAPDLPDMAWDPLVEVHPAGHPTPPASPAAAPVVAIAGGRAFTFRYPETEELLRAAGCALVTFDPLTDDALPEGTRGIYLGGGFPQVYAEQLAANRTLLADLRAAVDAGIPTVAECAGLLYLAESLDGTPMSAALPAQAAMAPRLTLRYPVAVAAGDNLLTRTGERVSGHEFHRTRCTPQAGSPPAWIIDGAATGWASATTHASYLHVHWAGHPHLAQRFADAAHAASPRARPARARPAPAPTSPTLRAGPPAPAADEPVADPLRHHGDVETGDGLADFAVNVHDSPRPGWLEAALGAGIEASSSYPDATPAAAAVAAVHSRDITEVLPTAGAAEAFTLIARLRPWRHPVVVHPQFTEPHAALARAGCDVHVVICRPETGFTLEPGAVPAQADLVVVGNPTNPTGVLHSRAVIDQLRRPGRLVVVDEAFMDTVPGQGESLLRPGRHKTPHLTGVLVIRSLTKLWSIPGIRAGYVVGDPAWIAAMEQQQTPWSLSAPAIAATVACCTPAATTDQGERAAGLARWRQALESELTRRGIEHVPSSASFVLARPGAGIRAALRKHGIAVRRADTFPGLDETWVRIAVRAPETTALLARALDEVLSAHPIH